MQQGFLWFDPSPKPQTLFGIVRRCQKQGKKILEEPSKILAAFRVCFSLSLGLWALSLLPSCQAPSSFATMPPKNRMVPSSFLGTVLGLGLGFRIKETLSGLAGAAKICKLLWEGGGGGAQSTIRSSGYLRQSMCKTMCQRTRTNPEPLHHTHQSPKP